jgi:vancomycin resistance protein YoaR
MSSHRSKVVLFACGWLLAAGAIGTGVYLGSGGLMTDVDDYSLAALGSANAEPLRASSAAAFESLVEGHAAQVAARDVALTSAAGAALGTVRLADVGATIDVPATVERLAIAARRERLHIPLVGARATSDEAMVVVAPVVHIDMDVLTKKALELKDKVDVEPVSARIDLDAHKVIAEEMGLALDPSGLAAAVEAAATTAFFSATSPAMAIPTVEIAPKITRASAEAIDITTVVSEFETHFSRGGEQVRRGQNIDRAASKLDGLVLPPNQVVSFNAVVGDRSEANGFKKSWEIFKGEMVEGIGGGTCQVASTIHAASFFGGLDVLERLPHSRPSAYITMGLDSTVVYPSVDLKLRNPYPFPVVVHTKTTANTLRVELLGKEKPVTVKFSRELLKRVPYTRKLVEESGLASNRVVHKQHGIDGYRIKRFREMVFADGTTKKEETTDFYPPTFDIYEVPVGFDEARLPSVPQDGEEPVAAPVVATVAGSTAHSAEGAATAGTDDLVVVDGKGAHAPNRGQLRPEARLRMGR